MRHFALTHSLTLMGNESSPVRMILLVRKRTQEMLPCYWLRVDEADLEEAIALGRSVLSKRSNIVVAIARRDVPDTAITAYARKALDMDGLHQAHLVMHPGEFRLPGAA